MVAQHFIEHELLGMPSFGLDARGAAVINGASLGHALNALPNIVFFGDSTFTYSHAVTGSAKSLLYNGDGTATITLTSGSNPGIDVDDLIGVQGTNQQEFKVFNRPVLALAINGNDYAYRYALNPSAVPRNASDGVTAANILYPCRASGAGPMSWLMALTGRRFACHNLSQQGDTFARMTARFSYDAAQLAAGGWIVSTGGINNAVSGQSLGDLIAEFLAFRTIVAKVGAKLLMLTPFPQLSNRANWSSAKELVLLQFRNWLRRNASKYNYVCIDWGSLAYGNMQIINPTSTTGAALAAMVNGDRIHPLVNASYMAGKALASFFNRLYGTSVQDGIPRNLADCGIMPNGLLFGTGGTAGAGVTGQVANNFGVAIQAGAPAVTCALAARSFTNPDESDNAGNWQTVTVTPAQIGDQVKITLPNLANLLACGNQVLLEMLVKLESGANQLSSLELVVNSQTSKRGNLLVADMMLGTTQRGAMSEGYIARYGFLAPVRSALDTSDKPTNFQPSLIATAAAAGAPFSFGISCVRAEVLN